MKQTKKENNLTFVPTAAFQNCCSEKCDSNICDEIRIEIPADLR
jgi:hypothetical protein